MKAGQELDVAVAKEIFGWLEKKDAAGVWIMNRTGVGSSEGSLPGFSSNARDVQLVRQAMGDRNLGSTFQKHLEKVTGKYGDNARDASPEHICLAALAAIREK